jgi:hypothetical protein
LPVVDGGCVETNQPIQFIFTNLDLSKPMEDSNVPFADTTAKRAQLMAATEQFKSSITQTVDTIRNDAEDIGKTVALVTGVAVGVFLIASAILPKSDEYRYAEKYGELDDHADADDLRQAVAKHAKRDRSVNKSGGAGVLGLLGSLLVPILTNLARQQVSQYAARLTNNDATKPQPAVGSFQPFTNA